MTLKTSCALCLILTNNSFTWGLVISSLYTNMPVPETTDFILSSICAGILMYKGISREIFRKLHQLALNNMYFKFNGQKGLTMGASLSPTVANIFLNYFETPCFTEYTDPFKFQFYKQCLDNSQQWTRLLVSFILYYCESSNHSNTSFTFEDEIDGTLTFLDAIV